MIKHPAWTVSLLLAFGMIRLFADEATDPSLLTLDRIYDSDALHAKRIAARWLADGSAYTTLESSASTPGGQDIVHHDPRTGDTEILVAASLLVPPGASSPLAVEDHAWSADRSKLLVSTNGMRVWRRKTRSDYWVLDRTSRELSQLGGNAPPSTLQFAKFSPDGRHVAYVRAGDIYVEELRLHTITRLTTKTSGTIINGTFDWVYEEELSLRDGFRWSPDGRWIAYWQIDTEGVREFSLINNTDALYPRIQPIPYPKVGEVNSACRVGVISAQGGETRWLKIKGDPRQHYIARMDWAANSKEIVAQQFNRLQNTNWVVLVDARSGEARTILKEEDKAWVEVTDDLNWVGDGAWFTWVSERDGWRHVYRVSRSGHEVQCLTPGEFDVIRLVHVDETEACVYFIASPDNATQAYLYRVRLDGTGLARVTPAGQSGSHRYQISPDGQWAIHETSTFDTPPVTTLVSLPKHEKVRDLETNDALRETLAGLKRPSTAFFRIDIGDGVRLDAWRIEPPDLDPKKTYPLLVYVYGEPAGQTVLDRWGGSGALWHWMLAQRGYIVMSIDNRGTRAPRGRAWRKSIYRQVGILASADQAAALRTVQHERPTIDPKRVGVWGWSGGGSMSLNLIFRHPDLYHTAMAVAPVPNQRLYDTIYQERYMGLPSDNVDGFVEGSPITHAHRLKGHLLLVHGTGDDNCHYQGTEALINELIRHGKRFSMMAYPNRSHSIREGAGTTRHLRDLLTTYLETHLPAGGRPRGTAPKKL